VTKDALAKLVCLAVHRYGLDPAAPKSYPPSAWAIRFNVMAYPQFRFIDAEGRQLDCGNEVGRTPYGIALAVQRALAAHAVPKRGQAYAGDGDAVEQLAWLNRLGEKLAPEDRCRVEQALTGPNDWVRIRALEVVGRVKEQALAEQVAVAIDLVLNGRPGYDNPNNVLMAACQTSKALANPILVPALATVLAKRDGRNMATFYAVEALVAVGRAHGHKRVDAALDRALELEGHLAPRIRVLVEGLRKQ
jgi:hypothetical protein